MSTVTAQIFVGLPGTLHAGIRPTRGLSLFESSRPSRALAPLEGCPGRLVRRGTL